MRSNASLFVAIILITIVIAFALISITTAAWQTPGNGEVLDVDDIVDISEGAVVEVDGEYVVHDNITIVQLDRFKVPAGSVLRFKAGTSLTIKGSIQVDGAPGSPVVFTNDLPTKNARDWVGIVLESTIDTNSYFDHCIIEATDVGIHGMDVRKLSINGVQFNTTDDGILFDGISDTISISNSSFRNVEGRGIGSYHADHISVIDSVFYNSTWVAMGLGFLENRPEGSLTISNCTVTAFTGITVYHCAKAMITGSSVHTTGTSSLRLYKCKELTVRDTVLTGREMALKTEIVSGKLTNVTVGTRCNFYKSHLVIDGLLTTGPTIIIAGADSTVSVRDMNLTGSHTQSLRAVTGSIVDIYSSTITGAGEADLFAQGGSTINLYDSHFGTYTFDEWHENSTINSYHTVLVRVLTPLDVPIVDALVHVWNDEGDVDFQARTNAMGWTLPRFVDSFNAYRGGHQELDGPLHINATNGWLYNGSDVQTNATVVVAYVLSEDTPPSINIDVPTEVDEDTIFTLSAANSTDNDPSFLETGNVTWIITGRDPTRTIFGFQVQIEVADPGVIGIEVIVRDASGNPTGWNGTIIVHDITPPELIEDLSDTTATTGDPFTFVAEVTDNIGIKWVFVEHMIGEDLSTHTNELMVEGPLGTWSHTISIPADSVETVRYTIRVFDLSENRKEGPLMIVTVVDDDAPMIAIQAGIEEAIKGSELRLDPVAMDNIGVDSVYIIYHYGDGAPTNMTAEDHVMLAIPRHPEGKLNFHFVAMDSTGNWGSSGKYSITLVNAPPEIDDLPTWDVTEETDAEFDLSSYVTDPNDEVLTVSCSDESVTIEGMVLKLRHDVAVPDRTVTLTITDGEDQTDADLTIHVVNVNDAPVIEDVYTVDGSKFKVDEKVTFVINVTDEDLDELTVTWKDGDTVLGTGETIVYQKLKPGRHTVTVTVDDGTVVMEDALEVVIKKEEESPGTGLVVALAAVVLAGLAVRRRR